MLTNYGLWINCHPLTVGCSRFMVKEHSMIHSLTSLHVLVKLLKLTKTTKEKKKERIKKESFNILNDSVVKIPK